jgi:hypothetical protein
VACCAVIPARQLLNVFHVNWETAAARLSNRIASDLRALTAKNILSSRPKNQTSISGAISGGWDAWRKVGIDGRLGGEHIAIIYIH